LERIFDTPGSAETLHLGGVKGFAFFRPVYPDDFDGVFFIKSPVFLIFVFEDYPYAFSRGMVMAQDDIALRRFGDGEFLRSLPAACGTADINFALAIKIVDIVIVTAPDIRSDLEVIILNREQAGTSKMRQKVDFVKPARRERVFYPLKGGAIGAWPQVFYQRRKVRLVFLIEHRQTVGYFVKGKKVSGVYQKEGL
jgi:hypothetical protein